MKVKKIFKKLQRLSDKKRAKLLAMMEQEMRLAAPAPIAVSRPADLAQNEKDLIKNVVLHYVGEYKVWLERTVMNGITTYTLTLESLGYTDDEGDEARLYVKEIDEHTRLVFWGLSMEQEEVDRIAAYIAEQDKGGENE